MFRGSLVALVTPMTESGEIDHVAFGRLLDWHGRQGTDGIVVCGTTGESATVSAAETAELLQIAVQRIGGRVPVIAGTGSNSTAEAVERTRAACELGVDGVLVVTPYYNRPPQEGLYRHFSLVADAASVPLILYNVPSRTACDLLPETVERLAAHSQIIGIKEATGSVGRGAEILARCGDDFLLFSGDDATCRDLILGGAQGVISVTANVAPKLMREMVEAALAGDKALAGELDGRLAGLHRDLFVEANPIPAKWALERLGLIAAGIRLPLTWLPEAHQGKVLEAMRRAGVIE
ncbi:MAG: 4-hydroxy-tetrahydrodipicolinate synthase [Steroidobacteraceae bacterium]|jgi:4-hydroxy-tetrahydrodipicolinate synthase|nr:4-hydroxy-tetrahydrodipicolinate synthase [Steroidobacteraceae bacterium]